MYVAFCVIGIWLAAVISFCILCAIAAVVTHIENRRKGRELLSSASRDSPGAVCTVVLFYEPHFMSSQVGGRLAGRTHQIANGGTRVSSRLTSYPCGI